MVQNNVLNNDSHHSDVLTKSKDGYSKPLQFRLKQALRNKKNILACN